MSDPIEDTPADATQEAEATPARKRPKPGERRLQGIRQIRPTRDKPGLRGPRLVHPVDIAHRLVRQREAEPSDERVDEHEEGPQHRSP